MPEQMQLPLEPQDILWLQAPLRSVTQEGDSRTATYHRILNRISWDAQLMNLPWEYVYDPATDTTNIAGPRTLISRSASDLIAIGFKLMKIPEKASMDAQAKTEFRDMILRGGSYRGT